MRKPVVILRRIHGTKALEFVTVPYRRETHLVFPGPVERAIYNSGHVATWLAAAIRSREMLEREADIASGAIHEEDK